MSGYARRVVRYKSQWQPHYVDLMLKWGRYRDGNIALQLYDEEGPFMTATVNTDAVLEPGLVAIKDYSENEGIFDALLAAGVIDKVVGFVHLGFVQIPVCRLTEASLDEIEKEEGYEP